MKLLDDSHAIFTAAHAFTFVERALDEVWEEMEDAEFYLPPSVRAKIEATLRQVIEDDGYWDSEPPAAPDAFAARVAWKNRQLEASRRKNLLA